jgi:hypothetical protein
MQLKIKQSPIFAQPFRVYSFSAQRVGTRATDRLPLLVIQEKLKTNAQEDTTLMHIIAEHWPGTKPAWCKRLDN